mmetsp:Transcript_45693/g.106590  ORF Transcript_45693/g.106590 Transcript_45693/m.106590 type:complete len:235 (-) Transcript_45693:279-983(-)
MTPIALTLRSDADARKKKRTRLTSTSNSKAPLARFPISSAADSKRKPRQPLTHERVKTAGAMMRQPQWSTTRPKRGAPSPSSAHLAARKTPLKEAVSTCTKPRFSELRPLSSSISEYEASTAPSVDTIIPLPAHEAAKAKANSCAWAALNRGASQHILSAFLSCSNRARCFAAVALTRGNEPKALVNANGVAAIVRTPARTNNVSKPSVSLTIPPAAMPTAEPTRANPEKSPVI